MVCETPAVIKCLSIKESADACRPARRLSSSPPSRPHWEKAESAHLKNITQVTKDFVRAGEGYFSPDGKTIIFQAEEKDGGNPFYQIFTMDLATGATRRVSTGVGKMHV